MPTISKSELDKLNKKQGVYSSLSKPVNPKGKTKLELEVYTLSRVIKNAFLEYATAHGCKAENLELEWKRFGKILQRYL